MVAVAAPAFAAGTRLDRIASALRGEVSLQAQTCGLDVRQNGVALHIPLLSVTWTFGFDAGHPAAKATCRKNADCMHGSTTEYGHVAPPLDGHGGGWSSRDFDSWNEPMHAKHYSLQLKTKTDAQARAIVRDLNGLATAYCKK